MRFQERQTEHTKIKVIFLEPKFHLVLPSINHKQTKSFKTKIFVELKLGALEITS
jgi:hypothetical protein